MHFFGFILHNYIEDCNCLVEGVVPAVTIALVAVLTIAIVVVIMGAQNRKKPCNSDPISTSAEELHVPAAIELHSESPDETPATGSTHVLFNYKEPLSCRIVEEEECLLTDRIDSYSEL